MTRTTRARRVPSTVLALAALAGPAMTAAPTSPATEAVAYTAALDPARAPTRAASPAMAVSPHGFFHLDTDGPDTDERDADRPAPGDGRDGGRDHRDTGQARPSQPYRGRREGEREQNADDGNAPDPGGAGLGEARLAGLIEDVTHADGYRYGARDSAFNGMDTAKVIDNPAGGYLAVYHAGNRVKLATSHDLKTWTFTANLNARGTQPTIAATPGGGFVMADEGNDGGGFVRVAYYRDLRSLYTARATKVFNAPRTLSTCNEGTPNIASVRLSPDIAHSVIELGMHYHQGCDTDREATARLTNFSQWRASADPGTDNALLNAAAAQGQKIGGNIGGRDALDYAGRRYRLHEVQYVKDQFATWRTYLYDPAAARSRPLNIRTHRGSRAFANPKFTRITAPSGQPAIVITLYLPAQGAAPFEAGELIYYRTLRSAPAPTLTRAQPRSPEADTTATTTVGRHADTTHDTTHDTTEAHR